jgi:uncharacterized protein (UPF0262 family)
MSDGAARPGSEPAGSMPSSGRLVSVTLDPASIGRGGANVEHEREVAIYDLLADNKFEVVGEVGGPYRLSIALQDDRLMLDIATEQEAAVVSHLLSLSPLRRIMKDYFIVCESYYNAIRTAPPSRIQAIDMGRRALHDEGSRVLIDRLAGKVTIDFDTARRLFTLICALRWKG